MICFGTRGHRRVGRHQWGLIGKAFAYGRRTARVVACVHCDVLGVKELAR